MQAKQQLDRRSRIRVVNKAPYTLECKLCAGRWQPAINPNGRVRRWSLRCPNPNCEYHEV